MKTVIIVQAHMGSTRLPNKVMKRLFAPVINIKVRQTIKAMSHQFLIINQKRDLMNKYLIKTN